MMDKKFKEDVEKGLTAQPKFLSSQYFYDKKGDELFQQIMDLPEYYLTRSELEIMQDQSQEIISAFDIHPDMPFELIELGAGDGLKTKELLRELLRQNFRFDYLPIDISQNALNDLEHSLKSEFPSLSVKTRQGEYFEVLHSLKNSQTPKIVLFLGSNLGNMSDETASEFMGKLGESLAPKDKLFLGVDLIKSREIVLPAYDDSQGVTREFNLNLLHRINRELSADFDIQSFDHSPEYLEEEGVAKSYLESKKDQTVFIKALGRSVTFKKGEKIFTEVSRKYNDEIIRSVIQPNDFKMVLKLTDSKNYFADYIFSKN